MKKPSKNLISSVLTVAGLLLTQSCAPLSADAKPAKPAAPIIEKKPEPYVVKSVQHGKASWYSIKTNYGTATASGQRLRNDAATAAHKTLPMGTKVRVTNLANNRSEIVTINDRGPYVRGRVIDVTIGTAEKMGFVGRGVVPVKVEVLNKQQVASR